MYYFFLKKILNVFQKNDKKPVLIPDFFPQKISKMETKYKKASKSLARSFFFHLHSGEGKKELGMDTVEHTASTILVVQIVTKNFKERTLSIPYWSFGCLQTTWISVGAVLFFFFFFFFLFFFAYCSHMRRVGFASALLPYGH